jgi:lipopolysaccharide/colanic/teichoic acid biosynthesis glycosyltransferase
MTTKKNSLCPGVLVSYIWWKGVLDRCFAFLALMCLFPLFLIITVAIRIDSPGNPIFCQERVGKNGRRFTLYKFRSMYQNHDDAKYQTYIKKYVQENLASVTNDKGEDIYELIHDPRVTKTGFLLRRSDLDELPQLINIVKGDMSFIGPRPDIPFAVELYTEHHKQRLAVKPGMTGAWQVLPERRWMSFNEVVQADLDYIKSLSLFLDIKILLLTVREVLTFGSHIPKSGQKTLAGAIETAANNKIMSIQQGGQDA